MAENNTILIGEREEPTGNAPSGKQYIWIGTDGHLRTKDDAGVVKDNGVASDAVQKTIIDSKGDLIIGTADNAYTKLSTPTLISGDGHCVLGVKDYDSDTLMWMKHKTNGIELNYINAATYTVSYHSDHIIVGTHTSDMVFSFDNPTYFPTTGRGKEYIFKNGSSSSLLIVKLYGSGTFQNGLNEIKIYPRGTLKIGMVRPNIADGALLLQNLYIDSQIRYDGIWADTNFSSITAIPFDTNDHLHDSNVIDHDISTNNSRLYLKILGEYNPTFWFSVDSTGGSASYSVEGYVRKNGTDEIAGSHFYCGNYKTEDSFVSLGPLSIEATNSTDYIEVMIQQTGLTGYLKSMVLKTYCYL